MVTGCVFPMATGLVAGSGWKHSTSSAVQPPPEDVCVCVCVCVKNVIECDSHLAVASAMPYPTDKKQPIPTTAAL